MYTTVENMCGKYETLRSNIYGVQKRPEEKQRRVTKLLKLGVGAVPAPSAESY